MNLNNKRLAVNMTFQILSFCVTFAIGFFLTPFIVGSLGDETYGFISLSNNIISYLSLITLAINAMATRHISVEIYKKDDLAVNKYVSSLLISNILMSFILFIGCSAAFLNIEKLINVSPSLVSDLKITCFILLFNFIISLIGNVYSIATFATNKLHLNAIRNSVGNMIRAAVLMLLFSCLAPKMYYVAIGSVVSTLYGLVWNIRYTRRYLPNVKVSIRLFEWTKIRILLASGIWSLLNRLSNILNEGLDLLITNLFISAPLMGVLAIAKMIPTQIFSIVGTLTSSFTPNLVKAVTENNQDSITQDTKKSISVMGFLISIILGVFIGLGYEFFEIWVPMTDTKMVYQLALLTVMALILSGATAGIYEVFVAKDKIKVNSLVVLGTSILNVILVPILLKTTNMGIYAVAGVSSTISIIKNIAFTLPYASKLLNQKWYFLYFPAFRCVLCTAAIAAVTFLVKLPFCIDNYIILILLGGLCGLLGCIINFIVVLSKKEKLYFFSVMKTKLKIKKP